ncbi:hypothetical protein ACFW04_011714 [Cataglyphis niger]
MVCRPSNSGYLNKFFQSFLDSQVGYRHSIILKDFSADINQNIFKNQQLGSFIFESSLYLVLFRSTHHLRNSRTLLDLCIIDDRDKLKEFGQCGVAFLLAHDLIFIRYGIKLQRRHGKLICRSGFDVASFQSDVDNIDWIDVSVSDNMDEKIDIFCTKLLNIFNAHRSGRMWCRHKNDVFYDRYKMLRKILCVLQSASKASEVWGKLSHLGLIKARNTGGRLSHFVEELNAFFGHNAEHADYMEDETFTGIMPRNIVRVISRAKSNAVGGDGIPLRLLKLTIYCTLPILEHLFNFSLMNDVFLVKWKSALICPIPTVRNPTLVQNYRPISILPTLSKALERLICAQIRVYCYVSATLLFSLYLS